VDGKLRIRYGFKTSLEELMKPADGNTFFLHENDLTEIKYFKGNNGLMTSFIFYNNSQKLFIRVK
jgi:hypothetical protein